MPWGGGSLACHVDISNCFWSLVLPPQYCHSFGIRVDDMVYAFKALPFGWAYSPVICQEVLSGERECATLSSLSIMTIFW